jgi:Holliday junction DNA helicase RuvA
VIARLRGRLCDRTPEEVVVDVAGVGYQVFASAQTLAALPGEGSEVDLLIVTHLRDDALQLFGFADAAERTLFQLLHSVSGIGPRLALNILSGMPAAELREAIRRRDLVRLTRIPGVGKKIARRLKELGFDDVYSLKGQNPETMFLQDCAKNGQKLDRCLLYVYRLAVYYAENETYEAEKLKWWNWKDESGK